MTSGKQLAVIIVVVSVAALLFGGWLNRLRINDGPEPLGRPRFSLYTKEEAETYFSTLRNQDGLGRERTFLLADLAYPVVYGGGLTLCLLLACRLSPHALSANPGIALAVAAMLGDWTENIGQLTQLAQFEMSKPVDATVITIASLGTLAKWICLGSGLEWLTWVIVSARRP